MSDRIFFKAVSLSVLTLAVAACGDSGGNDVAAGGGASPMQDSFIAIVSAVVASSSDNAEPRETDSITATSPEDSEAIALDS